MIAALLLAGAVLVTPAGSENPVTISYPVLRAATADGTLDLAWTGPAGAGGSGREHQIAETWLIPEPSSGAHP